LPTPERSIDTVPNDTSSVVATEAEPYRRQGLRPWHLLILLAVALLPYLNSLHNGFVYDDFDQVLGNPYLRNFHHLREIFTSSVWSFMGDFRASTNYYRPVMSLGYLACYQLFGPRALAFHLANLLGNVAVVLLVLLVTFSMFRSAAVAMAAACIFALHPIHSEAVNWIAAATELELALFYLLTFWLFLASARAGGSNSAIMQLAMAGSFVLTLLSKEQALTLPLLVLLYEHCFREDRGETTVVQKLRRYGALWLLAAAYVMLRVRYLRGFAPSFHRPGFGILDLSISALALIGRYCWKLLWPAELCAYYVFPTHASALYPAALRGACGLAFCALIFVVLLKFDRQPAFGMVWLLVTLAPVLNVRWMPANPFTERYLYLPSVGFCWIAAWAAVRLWDFLSVRGSQWRMALPLAAGLVAALWVIRILTRNRDWRDNLTFYTTTLKFSPEAYYIHNNLGIVYWAHGNTPAAEKEWRTTLRLDPTNEIALHNLGLISKAAKRYQQAENLFLLALAIRPNYSDAHLDLGLMYQATGRVAEAEVQLRAAENLSPLNVRAHNALSEFYFDRRQLGESEAESRRSVEIEPNIQGYWDLGLAEWMKGDRGGAERALLDAEALGPSNSRAHFMLGLFYRDSGRTADAIHQYRAGLQLDPTNAEAVANLKELEFLAEQR
jgi:tetratricopeptide (TPR) repeat protein